MSMATLADSERADLCDLMLEVGAEAPTLDEGWFVHDLAAHLVVREHDLWAAPGLMLGGPARALLDTAMQRRRRRGLEALVATVRRGPPRWMKLAPSGSHLNEYYIHHEDVRRANGRGPRTDRPDLDEGLARLLGASARLLLRRFDAGVDMVWQGGVIVRHGAEPRAELNGAPGELLLYASGRKEAARVELGGDPEAAAQLAATNLSL